MRVRFRGGAGERTASIPAWDMGGVTQIADSLQFSNAARSRKGRAMVQALVSTSARVSMSEPRSRVRCTGHLPAISTSLSA